MKKMNNQNGVSAVSFVEDALEHHGIKGQKWGVTHGPPYPLDFDVSKDIKKEAKKREKDERLKQKIKQKKEKYAKDPKKVRKHIDMYEPEEIANVLKTFEFSKRLKDYEMSSKNKSRQNIVSYVSSFVKAGTSLAVAYNLVASVDQHLGGKMRPIKILHSA